MPAIFDGSPRSRCDEARCLESKTLSLLNIVCDQHNRAMSDTVCHCSTPATPSVPGKNVVSLGPASVLFSVSSARSPGPPTTPCADRVQRTKRTLCGESIRHGCPPYCPSIVYAACSCALCRVYSVRDSRMPLTSTSSRQDLNVVTVAES